MKWGDGLGERPAGAGLGRPEGSRQRERGRKLWSGGRGAVVVGAGPGSLSEEGRHQESPLPPCFCFVLVFAWIFRERGRE